jgi:DNA-3-methyladenine glycosylase I
MERRRCGWVTSDPLYVRYHDEEWGVPVHDDRRHYEFMVLESAQSGLSWLTILRKREGYRGAFAGFDPERVARYDESDVERLMQDAGIVRNRRKIVAAIENARAMLEVQKEHGSFDAFIWSFVSGKTRQNRWATMQDVPASTAESTALADALKKRGFRFLGPVVCYAHMQACGLVNDHTTDCFRYAAVSKASRR